MVDAFWRPRSLASRQLLVASLGLMAFLALVGFALDRAFMQTAEQNLHSRLQNYATAYAAGTEFDVSGALIPMADSPDPRLDRPGSGLYAQIVGNGMAWTSASTSGPQLPVPKQLAIGQEVFDGPLPVRNLNGFGSQVYRYGRGLGAMDGSGNVIPYTVYILEDTRPFMAQMNTFRRSLWTYMAMAGLVLLLLQMLTLRWSLRPLRNVVTELERVKDGRASKMSGRHPRELAPLTESVNSLIDSERLNLERQRNVMGDLAHSLKTPLAVMRTSLDSHVPEAQLREDVDVQLRRMNDIVGYQLGRARSTGHKLYAAPIEVERHAEDIVSGLEKIYARKGILCEFDVDAAARFHGEQGDLQELLGNLLENAFKWANSRVLLTVAMVPQTERGARRALRIAVEDDGPGIPKAQVMELLQRGVRGDERVQGHGIGLSIVQDIVHGYRGELDVSRSGELGGAKFEVTLPR